MKLKLLFFASVLISFPCVFLRKKTQLEIKHISFNDELRRLNFEIENDHLHDDNKLHVNLFVNETLRESNRIDFVSLKQKTFSYFFFISKNNQIISNNKTFISNFTKL